MSSVSNNLIASARQKWLADQHEEALQLFRKAVQATPNDLRLNVEFASYLGLRFEVSEARELLQRCENDLADNPAGLYQVGLAYERAFLPDDALRCFQRALKLAPTQTAARISIAEWLDRRGMLAEAKAVIEQASSDIPEIKLARAKSHQRRGEFEEAERILLELTSTASTSAAGISDELLVSAWFALAKIYDVTDRSGQAFSAASSAKTLQRREATPHLQRAKDLAKLESNFVATVTQDHYRRWSSDATQPSANHASVALLTGSPRSGTTLLAQALGKHSKIELADEMNAYATFTHREMLAGMSGTNAGEALDAIASEHLETCRQRYLKWMRSAIGRQHGSVPNNAVLLDKNPSTTFLIPAFRRLFPKAMLIMAIRDPRDVVISCFLQHFPLNPVSAMFSRLDYAVIRCRAEVEAWLRLRDKLTQPWCEVRYEELVRSGDEVLQPVLSAMNLDRENDLLDFQSGLRNNPARSPTYADLFENVHSRSVGRWQRYAKHLAPFMEQLQPLCEQLGYA